MTHAVAKPFWTEPADALCRRLDCETDGLGQDEAERRLVRYGRNADASAKAPSLPRAVARRLLEPLSLLLLAAGLVSAATGDGAGGAIIVTILAVSIGLDTLQEGGAIRAADVLRRSVALKAEVKRGGTFVQVAVETVVPGDLIRVRAGDIIPADALVLEGAAFTANEAALTGEPYPVEKRPGPVAGLTAGEASNALFRGAVAQTGEAVALVVSTGPATLFGAAASALALTQDVSPFQRDLRAYGLLTARLTLALVLVVFTAHLAFGRPLLQSLLFAVALAVGLTPELLPMITTVTLSRGALRMAKRKVIVKRLASIHDLGAMTVLCTDKTGTLTSAEISLARSLDAAGADDPRPSRLGAVAASLGGDRGALDAAMMAAVPDAAAGWTLRYRQAFDFGRRLGSVLATGPDGDVLVVKGAPESVLAHCVSARAGDKVTPMSAAGQLAALAQVRALAEQGLRAVAIASRPWTGAAHEIGAQDEAGLIYEGLCAFADPPKATAAAAIARLAAAGVRLKILSGDDPVVVRRLAGLVGLKADRVLSGADLAGLSDDALAVQVRSIDAYGRLAPDQKARLVRALQARGAVVGYLGDGINDAPALKAAHIGLSVAGATGVAQAAADMILLDSDLAVVADGVEEGRRTFANILKYVRMGASSNFGNMLSMAAASLFLPFLPMLPTQILLNNLLYDVSEIGIPFDSVRPEALARPQVWDMRGLIRFAAVMGPLSSAFDLLTFAGLLLLVHVTPAEFRTVWFLESMATQILVIFIIRTNGRPWRDLPRPILAASSLGALVMAMVLPFTPLGAWFGFKAPSLAITGVLALVVFAYLVCAELAKGFAVRRLSPAHRGPPTHRAQARRVTRKRSGARRATPPTEGNWMTRSRLHAENHHGANTGWLRAAVLGANDGLLSTASLVLGVASANANHQAVLIAGVAGLVAGAMSMAAGEYVSVSSQSDSEQADLKREGQELHDAPVAERAELKAIYVSRGLDDETAQKVADQLTAKDALSAHARDELGLSSLTKARPVQAALASAAAFTAGAAAPLLVVAVTPHAILAPTLWATALAVLLGLGLMAAKAGGASPWRAAPRVVFWGALAMGVTAAIGHLVGHAV